MAVVEYAGHRIFSSVSIVYKISHAFTQQSTIVFDKLLLYLSPTKLEVKVYAATNPKGFIIDARQHTLSCSCSHHILAELCVFMSENFTHV